MTAATGKVFGIGMRKTGTRSLASACRILDRRTMHKGGDSTSLAVVRAEEEGKPLLTYLGGAYDAYFDVEALISRYAALDRQYPDSRFLLTTRSEEAWLDSLERHVLANQERKARGDYDGSLLVVDRDRWRVEWATHHEGVRTYFADRPEALLELDVCSGTEGWDRLAPFLGRPVPAVPFPWENKDGLGTYRADAVLARARRVGVEVKRRSSSWRARR